MLPKVKEYLLIKVSEKSLAEISDSMTPRALAKWVYEVESALVYSSKAIDESEFIEQLLGLVEDAIRKCMKEDIPGELARCLDEFLSTELKQLRGKKLKDIERALSGLYVVIVTNLPADTTSTSDYSYQTLRECSKSLGRISGDVGVLTIAGWFHRTRCALLPPFCKEDVVDEPKFVEQLLDLLVWATIKCSPHYTTPRSQKCLDEFLHNDLKQLQGKKLADVLNAMEELCFNINDALGLDIWVRK